MAETKLNPEFIARLHAITLERGASAAIGHFLALSVILVCSFLTHPLPPASIIIMILIGALAALRRYMGLKRERPISWTITQSRAIYFSVVTTAAICWVLFSVTLFNQNGFYDLRLISTLLLMCFLASGSTASIGSEPLLGTSSAIILLSGVSGVIWAGNTTLVSGILSLSILSFGILVVRQFWLHHQTLIHSIAAEFAAEERAEQLKTLLEERSNYMENERRAAILDLASGVAHEINNPLTILMGRHYLLKGYIESSEGKGKFTALESLEVVQATIRRISGIVATMNLLTEGVEPDEIPETATDCLQRSINELSTSIETENIELKLNFEDLDGKLLKYGNVLNTCVNAVLQNAVTAATMSPKEPRSVSIHARQIDEHLQILISDSGPGIDRLNPESIFNPFMTTRDPGKGLGLGLSVARNLTERCGGILRVVRPSSPTTFEITTPLI